MSVYGLLGIGLNGMNANAFGTQTASNNASNVGTDGYSRRIADIRTVDSYSGSQARGSRRVVDKFVERRMLGANSFKGEATARAKTLSILDLALNDDAGNLADAMDQFTDGVAQLGSFPSDPGSRSVFLIRAQQLATAFNTVSNQLEAARADTNTEILDEVDTLNAKLREIGSLGQRIAGSEINGSEASDLRDRRDLLVREVAEIVPVKTIEETDGQVQVLLGGSKPLVNAVGEVSELTASIDALGDVQITRTSAGSTENVAELMTSGRIGGLLSARDGGLSNAINKLDQLAFDITSGYNAVHSANVGLDGATGRNLFEPAATAAGAARLMAISTDIAGNSDAIATAQDAATLPGDNRGILALQALQDSKIALGGTATAVEAYGDLVGTAASAVQDSYMREDQAIATSEQLIRIRESVSGVSTDEEMISLIKFQRGYQATLKIISTADEMLMGLMSLKR